MRVLVFAPYAINTPHFETDLEIIQTHLDQGDDVVLIGCDAALPSCDVNLHHDMAVCLSCIGRRVSGVRLLSKRINVKPLYCLTRADKRDAEQIRMEFSGLADLKQYHVDNFDIGYAVLSSLVSATRDPEPDIRSQPNGKILRRYMISAFAVYRSIRNHLVTHQFDRAYVYNGRYAPQRAALRACQEKRVRCFTHERGSTLNQYALYENTMPHDMDHIHQLIRQTWSEADPVRRERAAARFFLERSKGIVHNWFSFTKDQATELLPKNWDTTKTNVVIYVSSDDEFAAIGDTWERSVYESQLDGIREILDSVGDEQRMRVYLRIHPNLKDVKNSQTEQLASLKAGNLTVIPADSTISSYALLQNASKVVTFGSTVGIEATFWGIPSILAGPSFYRRLGATYNPATHEELLEMLYGDLPPKEKAGALMYGYYVRTFGLPFTYFLATGVFTGEFKSVVLRPARAFHWMKTLLQLLEPLTHAKSIAGKMSIWWNMLRLGAGLKAY